jgi:3-oxoacyl-[acyl-carrier-protein] synthase II
MSEKRRVVITGMGAVTSLGNNVKDTWDNLIACKSGVQKIDNIDISKLDCKIASILQAFDPENFIPAREIRKMDRFIHLGLAAAKEAIADSGWVPESELAKERTGVLVGSGIGGLGTIENIAIEFHSNERPKITPYFIPAALVNLLSGHIAIFNGFAGPNNAVSTACATGTHAIGDAMRIIQYGDADVMVAGSAEAPVTPIGVAGFSAVKALASGFDNRPCEASRPWDIERNGFVIGEGAGVLVLEEYEHAKRRGAKIYAEICGYGLTGDAFHMTSPNGLGAKRAIINAMKDAKVAYDSIDYINAHGTSTKLGDEMELQVVQELFASNKRLKMSSTKSSIGHLLGAAGSVEAIFTILAIKHSIAPATLNLYQPIEGVEINLVPIKPQETEIIYAISNSFGFGGTNASIVLKAF